MKGKLGLFIGVWLLLFGVGLLACHTIHTTSTAPDGTVTETETTSVDVEAIQAIVTAAESLGTTATELATQIAGIQTQIDSSSTDDDTDWTALLNQLLALYDKVTARQAALEVKARSMAQAESIRTKGLGAFYVDPITKDAVRNTESVR